MDMPLALTTLAGHALLCAALCWIVARREAAARRPAPQPIASGR